MTSSPDTRSTILAAASEVLERDGVDGFSTRAVCAAADVTAPTLYHHFGDKGGLIDAVVSLGIGEFMAAKRAQYAGDDPLADLRRGWNAWIEFGLRRPVLFRLMIERATQEPRLVHEAQQGMREALAQLHRSGRLAISEADAVRLVRAASAGVLSLFAEGESAVQVRRTGEVLFDAVLQRLTG